MALQPFKVGVISDTHSFLDPRVKEIFQGVDHIIHAGDIGMPFLILDLEEIAPVTAVLGNNDNGNNFKETEMLELNGRKFLAHHIVDPNGPPDTIKKKIIRNNPDVVIFGRDFFGGRCILVGHFLFSRRRRWADRPFTTPRGPTP